MPAPTLIRSAALALGLAAATAGTQAAPVETRIDTGVIVGDEDQGVAAFKGVPYAQPPVGPLRWRPPQPVQAWSGKRDAADFGAGCIQPGRPPNVMPDSPAFMTSEDCLTLNVWAPPKTATPRPVMVWIHGGGNVGGSSADPFYDGSAFARDGVVLVSLNYRLGVLGFFAHPALTAEAKVGEPLANFGLMDQLAALTWVERNIATFGGDPANVTVFGESAGGEDILALLTAPSAHGLFAKAIVESGGSWTKLKSLAEGEAAGAKVAALSGIAGTATADQLRALPASVLNGQPRIGPVVDGRFLPEQPSRVFAEDKAIDVPLIIGTNGEEGSLLGPHPIDPALARPALKPQLDRLRTAYGDQAKDNDTFARLAFRDAYFAAPARFVAAHESTGAPAYLYRFDYVVSLLRAQRIGATHASEIPFVFATWPAIRLTRQDHDVTQAMHGCWVAFARTGAPACANVPAWPAYAAQSDQWLHITADGKAQAAPVDDPKILDALATFETAVD